jgi:hypothetical protein
MGHAISKVLDIAAPVVLTAMGQPELAAVYSGGRSYSKNHNILGALGSAGGSYLGSSVGSSLGGSAANSSIGQSLGLGQSIGSALGNPANVENSIAGAASNFIGNDAGNMLGAQLSTTNLGSALGSFAGNSAGTDFGQSLAGVPKQKMQGPAPFQPTQAAAMTLPGSLSDLNGLSTDQQASNIANQGVYGGGAGPDEQRYFMNLMNRQLVDSSGHTSDMSGVNAIENSYLSQLGLGGYGDSRSLLEAMSKWKPA